MDAFFRRFYGVSLYDMSMVEALSLLKETKRVRETEGEAPKDHREEVERMIAEMDGTDDD